MIKIINNSVVYNNKKIKYSNIINIDFYNKFYD